MMKSALLPLADNARAIKTKFAKPGGNIEKGKENDAPPAAVLVTEKADLPATATQDSSADNTPKDVATDVQVPHADKAKEDEAKAGAIEATIKMKELLARFTPKKKPVGAEPAAATEPIGDVPVVVVDPEPPTIGHETIPAVKVTAPPPSPDTTAAKDTLADTSLASDKNKKTLARLFSLKRKREANSATPSLVEQEREPKLAYQPDSNTIVLAQPQDQGEASGPSSHSRREGWKRFRLSRDMSSAMNAKHVREESTNAVAPPPAPIPESPARVAETIDTYVTAPEDSNVSPPTIIDAALPEKKGFWVQFGRKNPSATGHAEATAVEPHASQTQAVDTPQASPEAEAVASAPESKPVAWKRLLSVRRKSEGKVTESTGDNAQAEAPIEAAPAAAEVTSQAERPAPVKADSKDEKSFRGLFFRKDTATVSESPANVATEVEPTAAQDHREIETEAKANDSTVGGASATPAKKTLSRIFSVQRNTSSKPEPQAVEPAAADGHVAEAQPAPTHVGSEQPTAADSPKPEMWFATAGWKRILSRHSTPASGTGVVEDPFGKDATLPGPSAPPQAALADGSVIAAAEPTGGNDVPASESKASRASRVFSVLRPNNKNKAAPETAVQPVECPTCSARKRDAFGTGQAGTPTDQPKDAKSGEEQTAEQAKVPEVPVEAESDLPIRTSSLSHSAKNPSASGSSTPAMATEAAHDATTTPDAPGPSSDPVIVSAAAESNKA